MVNNTDNIYYCTKNQVHGLCVGGDMVILFFGSFHAKIAISAHFWEFIFFLGFSDFLGFFFEFTFLVFMDFRILWFLGCFLGFFWIFYSFF